MEPLLGNVGVSVEYYAWDVLEDRPDLKVPNIMELPSGAEEYLFLDSV